MKSLIEILASSVFPQKWRSVLLTLFVVTLVLAVFTGCSAQYPSSP